MKLKEVRSSLYNAVVGYSFWCVACDSPHAFYTHDGYTNNKSWKLISTDPVTVQPSIKLTAPYKNETENYCCHLFLLNGKIRYLTDCTHYLAGKEIDMIDFPIPNFE
ncbi:MAG: DUF6527 family protein [Balneolaceae bacterium]